jgi:plastocyanin domain-containing protein
MTTLAHVSLSHLTTEALMTLAGLGVAGLATWFLILKSEQQEKLLRRVKAVYKRFDR